MPSEAVILFVAVGILFVVLAIYGSYASKKRREELSAWAASKALRFSPDRQRGLDDRYPQFPCLRQGSNRYAYNCMSGDWGGRGFLAFDYHYETHSTDSKGRQQTHHHHFSVVILDSKVPLKPLLIRPEGFFDKVKEFFGADDIDFESAEFSRKFFVKAPDRRWAYDVIHARTMEFLLGFPQFRVEFSPTCVIANRANCFRPEEFQHAAEVIAGLLDRLPEYLVRQQMGS